MIDLNIHWREESILEFILFFPSELIGSENLSSPVIGPVNIILKDSEPKWVLDAWSNGGEFGSIKIRWADVALFAICPEDPVWGEVNG